MLVATRSASPLLTAALLCLSASVQAERYTIPWFEPPGAGSDPQSVLRIVNAEADAATVTIHAIDDAGVRTGTAVLALNGSAAVDISAMELQIGDATKGLSSGVGNFSAGVRLAIESDVPIVPLALVRAGDGTLSALHDTVLPASVPGTAGYRYDVPIFHPASNVTQPSRLRLINSNDTVAQVAINAWDDTGAAASGGTVQLTVPPGGARTLSAQQLEAGDGAVLAGRLGAGVGNWRLSVSADRPIQVVNVAVGAATGYWSNLSTTAVDGWAPQDAASFEARFLGRTTVSRDGLGRTTFQVLADYGFLHTYMDEGVEIRQEGQYQYERTGRDAGLLRLDYDADVSCEARFYFGSRFSGWYAFACVDREDRVEVWTGNTWLSLDAAAIPLDLGSGLDDRVYSAGTAIDTLTLPAASGGDGEFTYSLSPGVPGLRFDPQTRELSGTPSEAGVYLMTYRVRDASGDTDWRYFNIAVETATGGGATTHGVGDTLSDLPTVSWTPDVTSGGSFSLSGGNATVQLNEGGYIEEGEFRFTCQSSGGCVIENRSVTSGSVVQTAKGTQPGAGSGGVADDHGDDRASATVVEAGSDTEGMLESDDLDYFRINVDVSGALEAYTSGRIDTRGWLEDVDGAVLGTNDDGGEGTNFRISEDVSAGTYYVRVAGYSSRIVGDYTLHVRFTGSDSGTTPPGGEQETTHGVGDTLSDLPSGFWTPDVLADGATFSSSGGNVTLRFSDGGYIEEGDYRYTCQSTGGCRVENGRVTSGTLVQTAKGTEPGGGGPGTGAQPSFATGSNPGDQSYTVDTAIDPLTLPEAEGDDGPLTYSLSPSVPGLSFNATATVRRLSGTPTMAGSYDMTYRVMDVDGDTDSLSFTITVADAGGSGVAPSGPDTVNVSREGSNIRVSWSTSTGATHYEVWRCDTRDDVLACEGGIFFDRSNWTKLASSITANSYVDRNPPTSTSIIPFDIQYVVQACNESGCSGILTDDGEGTDPQPDLAVEAAQVSDNSPATGASFTLSATVRNRGYGESGSTILRYYRSSNATISRNDTQVGTDSVSGLSASDTSAESISLTAPLSAGTYYYGACVDSVAGESDTDNNCSSAVRVTVSAGTGTQPDDYTPLEGLRVSAGRVQYGFFSAGGCIRLSNTTINGVTYTVHSSKWQRRDDAGSSWEDVPGTEQQGGLCAYNPTNAGEYRMVGEVSINGVRGRYSSENTIVVH